MNHRDSSENSRSSSCRSRFGVLPIMASLLCSVAHGETGFGAEVDGLLFNTVLERLTDPAFQAPDSVSAELKQRIKSYRARAQAFRSRIAARATSEGPERALEALRRRMEGGIVALIDAAGIEALAEDYAVKARIYYEWEGMSEGPIEEAAFAEEFLKNNPKTILKPYVELFLAHRYKCAAETLERHKDSAYKQAMQAFLRHLETCRKDADPLIRFIADSIRSRPFLYLRPDIASSMSGGQSRPEGPAPGAATPPLRRMPAPPEPASAEICPDHSVPQPTANPRSWALRCIQAEFGKEAARPESLTQFELDFDGDGMAELFIGSTVARGNAGGLHYVFKRQGTSYQYMGSLSLHPEALKSLGTGEGGKPLMARYVRLGAGEGLFETVAYDDGRFVVRQSEKVDVRGKDAARMTKLFGSTFKPGDESGPAEPRLSIEKALALAQDFASRGKVDLSGQHIQSMVLRFEDKDEPKGLYWHVQWMWDSPRLGGEYGLKVFMDGRIVEARLGP